MIIYGTSDPKQIATKKIFGQKCPHCESINSIEITTYSRYFHLYAIPFIPLPKKAIVACTECDAEIKKYKDNSALQIAVQNEKGNLRIPITYFSGLFILVLLIGGLVYKGSANRANTQKYIEAPMTNDVYEFKTEAGHYSLFKIVDVTKDSVVVQYNNYESTKSTGLRELDDSIKYDHDNFYILSKAEIVEMYKEKTIFDINRD